MAFDESFRVEYDDQVVDRRWSDASEPMDWTPFPVGYGILLNERYQFPADTALMRMRLDHRRQLFVDNHVVAHVQGIRRQTHTARDHPANPVFAPHVIYPAFIGPDPEAGYRLYYNSASWTLHEAHSTDGIHWSMPELNVFDPARLPAGCVPDGPNNILEVGQVHGMLHEPSDPDPSRRWKAILFPYRCSAVQRHRRWRHLGLPGDRVGRPYELWVSPDGRRWRFEAETNHWLGPSGDFVAPNGWPVSGSDVFRVRWDPVLRRYIGCTKHRIGPDPRFSPIFGAARVVGQIESDDLIHWTPPRIIACPDGEDAHRPLRGMHGIYEADGYPYESLWLNNFSMSCYTPATARQRREKNLIPNRPYLKRNWLRLAASRDGRHWYYFGDRRPFIDLGPDGSWKSGYLRAVNLMTVGGPIVKDDELWFYYRGSTIDGPKTTWRSALGLATLRRDGFVSLNAEDEEGIVITRPLVFDGEGHLFVNAEVGGSGWLRVGVVEEDTAEPLPGFGPEDCVAVERDTTRSAVRWRQANTLAPVRHRYVRLAFHLRRAKLYAFWIE